MENLSSEENSKFAKLLTIFSPFLYSFALKDNPVPTLKMFKGISLGQAGIGFGLILKNLDNVDPSLILSGFSLTFPIFLIIGIVLGLMEGYENKNSNFLSVIILILSLATIINILCLLVLFFKTSVYMGFSFLLSIVIVFNLMGFALKLYSEISTN